jgi:hypothetical protein
MYFLRPHSRSVSAGSPQFLKRQLGSLDLVTAWLHARDMISTDPTFTQTTTVINSGMRDDIGAKSGFLLR